jgi:predicted ATPase/DNA-binding SARP family transcriptional activator
MPRLWLTCDQGPCAGAVTGRRPPVRVASALGGCRGSSAGIVADDAGVRIHLLGGFEVTVADRPVAADAWRLRKAKTLVKLLTLARGHRLHREALVAVLWPDRDGASATNNLHQALYVARRALAGTSGALCCLRDDVVLLSDGPMPWLDTDAFEAACRRAHQTRSPDDYRAAAELYRGDLLPEDRFEDWSEGPREALRERHLGLLAEYADVLSDRGEHTQAVDIASTVTAADPFHEGAHRTLMTALAASGRRYEALAMFDRLREALAEEYAADPEPATRRLYRDLLTHGGAELDPVPAGEVAATEGAVARMPTGVKESLRPEHTSFIGRRRELAEISQALGRTRLLTLTGPGGAGKTRLAYEAAARLVDSYPDGVHVVELASLSRPDLVPQAVASVLDVPLPETRTAEVALARQLAERRLLLVLDNCEHLLDASARLAAALLRSCPDVVVLATSREPLRVGGEVTWRTPSLALPDLRTLPPLRRLAELESVRLFVERARDATPEFVLDETTAPAVAEVCVRLDGMPLALELAAARTSALALAQIAARLDDALHVLGRGSRVAVTRQQTLHATLAWSHELLDEDERVLFRRLAVFAGSMSLEAVEQVCGGGLDVVDLLSRLVDKSLVQAEHADGSARVLDLAVEAAAIMRRVADDKALAQILHLTGLLAWVEDGAWEEAVRLVEEGRSLAATAGAAGTVASATHMLGVIALMRGAGADAEGYLSETLRLLDRLPADLPPFFSAVTPGWFWELGPSGQPRLPFTETVLLYRRVGSGQAAAYTLSNLAYAVRLAGEPARARTLIEQSLGAFQRHGDLHGEGWRCATWPTCTAWLASCPRPVSCSAGAWRSGAASVTGGGRSHGGQPGPGRRGRGEPGTGRSAAARCVPAVRGDGRWTRTLGRAGQPRPGPARRGRERPGAAGPAAVARTAPDPLELPRPGVDPAGLGRAGATGRRRGHGRGLCGGGTTPFRRTRRRDRPVLPRRPR